MAVNLSKHGAALSDAYNEVVNRRTDTDWVLFTYEGNSCDIQVAAKGGGGLDQMVQELNAGKVMYAFCRVIHPNSGVPKFILINWTGEGVTGVRRGVCANHFNSMAHFLRGAHVVINAHSEDDVEPELIMNKVSQAVGVTYSLHTESNQLNSTSASRPVSSTYRKTNALEEIKGTNRDNFWAQMEEEEQTRRKQERKKAEEERQRVEKERKEQEERETAERERQLRERAKQINQQRLFEKKQETEHRNQQRQEPIQVEQELKSAEWKGIRSSRSVQEANGSKYYKTSALEEINGTDRENFWAQLEKEEQTRRQQERKKAEEERQRVEKERKEQEERETAERERQLRERAKQIDQQRLFEKKQETEHRNQQRQEPIQVEQELKSAEWKGIRSSRSVQEANGSKYYKTSALEEINGTDRENFWAQLEEEEQTRRQQERKKAEEERQRVEKERKEQEERETAERERQLRERAKQIDQQRLQEKKQEAKNINQQKSVEQELQAAQWKGIRSCRSVQEANDAAAIISQRAVNPRDIFSQKEINFLTNRASDTQPACNEEGTLEENIYNVPSHHRVYDEVKDDRMSAVKQSAGPQQSLYAKALYDYQAADETEITFDPGDIITVVEMTDEGWWHGYVPGGHYGMFPANYVELI